MNSPIILAILMLLQLGLSLSKKEETVSVNGTIRCLSDPIAGITINAEDASTPQPTIFATATSKANGWFLMVAPKSKLFQPHTRFSIKHTCNLEKLKPLFGGNKKGGKVSKWLAIDCYMYDTRRRSILSKSKNVKPNEMIQVGIFDLGISHPEEHLTYFEMLHRSDHQDLQCYDCEEGKVLCRNYRVVVKNQSVYCCDLKMFCFKRRSHPRNSMTSPSSAVVYPGHPGQSQPCRGFLTDELHHISCSHFPNDHTQHQQSTAPSQSHAEDLLCPISFYPNNVYGEGLDSSWGNRMDTTRNVALIEPQYYNAVRDPSIPLPPGVVLVQVIQPSAPPLSPRPPPEQLTLTVYPRLPPMDQSYADQQMAIQK